MNEINNLPFVLSSSHKRNQQPAVRPELVEGLVQGLHWPSARSDDYTRIAFSVRAV